MNVPYSEILPPNSAGLLTFGSRRFSGAGVTVRRRTVISWGPVATLALHERARPPGLRVACGRNSLTTFLIGTRVFVLVGWILVGDGSIGVFGVLCDRVSRDGFVAVAERGLGNRHDAIVDGLLMDR